MVSENEHLKTVWTLPDGIPTPPTHDKRGFGLQDPEIARRLRTLGASCSIASGVGTVLLDWIIILAAAVGSWKMFSTVGITVASVAAYGIAAFIIASRQQGLRNLIHDASHYNLARNRRWNDPLCRVGTFLLHPLTDLEEQRRIHVRGHHARFLDLPNDNVLRGYELLGLQFLPLPSRWQSLVILARGFFRLCAWQVLSTISLKDFLQKIGIAACLTGLGLLLILTMLFPWASLFGATAWLLYWAVPAVFVLPAIVNVVFLSEHVSTFGTTEFERSRNKLGFLQRVLLHPHGDGFHMLHHLYPSIPHHRLPRAHRLLMKDPVYRTGHHCYGFFFSLKPGGRSVLRDMLEGPRRPD
jgi:fatty acid desaturase